MQESHIFRIEKHFFASCSAFIVILIEVINTLLYYTVNNTVLIREEKLATEKNHKN